MIIIRQLMTEVLLEVTTEEIREAANEAMLFFKGKSYSRVYSFFIVLVSFAWSTQVTLHIWSISFKFERIFFANLYKLVV